MAFSSPVVMSMDRCVEVSVVRWAQTAGGSVADEGLAEHLKDRWRTGELLASDFQGPLDTTTVLESPSPQQIADEESKAWPHAKPLDFNRLGYLQHDLYPGRLFLPTMPGLGQLEVMPCGGGLEVKSGSEVVADFCYWNAGWGPVRPIQISGNCGTALVSRGTTYRASPDGAASDVRSFYFWLVRTLHRKGGFDSFDEKLAFGVTFV